MASGGFKNLLWFIGVVEDRRDPQRLGRVRVRVFDMHPDDKNDVPTEHLPWAVPSIGSYNTDYKPPIEGSWVLGFFIDGEDGQHPMIIGTIPGMATTFADPTKAFNALNDPFPIPTDLYQPDIPRQARGENIEETSVTRKYINQEQDIGEPDPPYNAHYPYNKVQLSESGHVIEVDDTPGSERLNIEHRSGSFLEIAPNGTQVNKIVGDQFTIVEHNGNVLIKGSANVTINGQSSITVHGDCSVDVDGNLNHTIHGDYNLNVAGEINVNAGSSLRARATSIRAEAMLDSVNIYAKRRVIIEGRSDVVVNSNTGSVGIFGAADVRVKAGSTYYQHSGGATHNFAGGDFNTEATGTINVGVDDSVSFDPSTPALGATPAFRTLLPKPPARKFVIRQTTAPFSYKTFVDAEDQDNDTHHLDIVEITQ